MPATILTAKHFNVIQIFAVALQGMLPLPVRVNQAQTVITVVMFTTRVTISVASVQLGTIKKVPVVCRTSVRAMTTARPQRRTDVILIRILWPVAPTTIPMLAPPVLQVITSMIPQPVSKIHVFVPMAKVRQAQIAQPMAASLVYLAHVILGIISIR